MTDNLICPICGENYRWCDHILADEDFIREIETARYWARKMYQLLKTTEDKAVYDLHQENAYLRRRLETAEDKTYNILHDYADKAGIVVAFPGAVADYAEAVVRYSERIDETLNKRDAEISDLEHERKDNNVLLWKVAEQQKEIEQLRSIIERRVGMLNETARESKRRIIRVIPPSPTTDDCQK